MMRNFLGFISLLVALISFIYLEKISPNDMSLMFALGYYIVPIALTFLGVLLVKIRT